MYSFCLIKRFCRDANDKAGCLCRLSNATFSLLDESSAVITEKILGNTCGVQNVVNRFDASAQFCVPTVPTSSPSPTSPAACYPNAKKIRLESTTGQQIQLFEVEAFSSGVNLAENAYATQSSTRKGFVADKAIDLDASTFSHTDDPNAWLEVDFGTLLPVESVTITNRYCKKPSDPMGCLCRLSNVTLSLLDYDDSPITSVSLGDTCGKHTVETLLDPSPSFCAAEVSRFLSQGETLSLSLSLKIF